MLEALSLPFFQRVLLAGLCASVAAGVIGTYVVVKKMTSVTGGLAHAAFGGVGLGYLLGVSPMLGAALFGLLGGLGVGAAYRRLRSAIDTSISMLWSAGMALGVVFVALTPGYAPDLTSYLFGSILFASWEYVAMVAVLDVAIVLVVSLLYRRLEAVTFDEEFSEVIGLPVERLLLVLFALIALSVIALIRVVGVILAIALMTVPAATARFFSESLRQMMLLATLIGAACTTAGLFASWELSRSFGVSVPSGPLIVLVSIAVYGAAAAVKRRRP
ncbi:MAG: metal ABC transporter permease [Sorangiineae bacterium]|nr:metal ABC transporter permease [Polyangiaceae bacterium]MEB2322144.1 metal ABC transporter permease [Sorangiineae bacterium]